MHIQSFKKMGLFLMLGISLSQVSYAGSLFSKQPNPATPPPSDGTSPMIQLPPETLQIIFSYLPDKDLEKLGTLNNEKLRDNANYVLEHRPHHPAETPPRDGSSPMMELSTEMVEEIFSYLNNSDLKMLGTVNTSCQKVVDDLQRYRRRKAE